MLYNKINRNNINARNDTTTLSTMYNCFLFSILIKFFSLDVTLKFNFITKLSVYKLWKLYTLADKFNHGTAPNIYTPIKIRAGIGAS